MANDVRWVQRFQNFQKAMLKLDEAVDMDEYTEMEREALIKRFEYSIELAWKTLQDLLKDKGYIDITGPKPVVKQAFNDGYISDNEGWIEMLDARNLTSHTYVEETAQEIADKIKTTYFPLLNELDETLTAERNK